MNGYGLCGLKVASALALPDLLPDAGAAAAPDLSIRLGTVPELDDPVIKAPLVSIGRDGTCRFEMKAVAAYRVDPAGREIVIEPYLPVEAPDIRVFLFGTVFAVVCFRRGLLPLHASVVRLGDKAVAFSGVSGAGKSTLAAMFLKRGFDIVADDVAVTDLRAGKAVVLPAFPRLKLWRDAMDGLCFDTAGLERARAELEKYHLPVTAFAAEPLPLAAVYHISEAHNAGLEEWRALTGVDAFLAMDRAVYRGRLGNRLIGSKAVFAMAGRVANAVRSVSLRRLKTLARGEAIIDRIIADESGG